MTSAQHCVYTVKLEYNKMWIQQLTYEYNILHCNIPSQILLYNSLLKKN